MKTKDLLYICVALALFIVVGAVFYSQFGKKATNVTYVEVVDPVSSELNNDVVKVLIDATKSRDFTPVIDLNNGLGNPKPFNPL